MRSLLVLAAISGCVAGDELRVPVAERADARTRPAMQLRVVGADGVPQPAWADKSDVFVMLVDAAPADYAFRVVDEHGGELSLDAPACRLLHVDPTGRVASACHGAGAGTVQLMPFADAEPDQRGTMHFIVQLAPAGTSFDASSLKATFAVDAWPSS